MITNPTPLIEKARRDTYEAVLVEMAHDQQVWAQDNIQSLLERGVLTDDALPKKLGERTTLCRTAACAAGHAVFTQIDELYVERTESFGHGVNRLRYRVGDRILNHINDAVTAVHENLHKVSGDDETLGVPDLSDHPAWESMGSYLLGLSRREGGCFFESGWSHRQIVFSLEQLVANLDPFTPWFDAGELANVSPEAAGHGYVVRGLYGGDYEEMYRTLTPPPESWSLPERHVDMDPEVREYLADNT